MPRLASSALACCRWQKLCSTRSTSRAHRYSEAAPSGHAGGESALEAPATSCWTAAVSGPCGWPGLQPLSSSRDSASRCEHATAKQASCTAAHLRRVRLQPQVHAVAASGCSLGLQPRLQPQVHAVAASNAWGCSLRRMGLQPPMHGLQPPAHAVAAHHSVRARAPMSEMSSRPSSRVVLT